MTAHFPPERQPTWKAVVGFEGIYEVSDTGLVRSLDRVSEYRRIDQYSGRELVIRRKHKGRLLRPGPNHSGHLSVVLGRAHGTKAVHLLVLEAFVGPCPEGHECLHWNDVAWDNRLKNLRWGTRSENLADSIRNGRYRLGERHPGTNLRNSDIPEIRKMVSDGGRKVAEIAASFGVTEAVIRQIRDGKTWRHV